MHTVGCIEVQSLAPLIWPWESQQQSTSILQDFSDYANKHSRVVDFCMHRVRMLVHFGITPYLVFDGDHLPSKAGTEKSRRDRRKESRKAGMELLNMGKTAQAHQELQKAVDITPEIARNLIEELKRNNVQYVVAPYEADSQLAYLEKKGIIDGVLSEDSDLLVFGVKTLLTKLDQYGDCVMVKQDDFTACRDINLVGWTCGDFRRMAILSGCDYLEGIHKMGLKTAHRMLRKYKTVDKVIRFAQLEGKMKIPSGYLEMFEQAEKTFLYQWVFCPEAQRMVTLTEPETPEVIAGIDYIGHYAEPEIAKRLAAGDLNPMTKKPIVVAAPPTNASYYKRTPLLQRSKTFDTGKNTKIDSFFRPGRKPLDELDPNSFTPSPSQQRTLAANANREWQADSVEARPSSAPTRAIFRRPALLERTNSAPNPAKRQRLCGDESNAQQAAQTQRSRFFNNDTSYQPSPLGAKSTAGKNKSKLQQFNLWSDDSIDLDAMAALPDIATQTETTPSASAIARIRKFSVFSDSPSSAAATPSRRQDDAQPSIIDLEEDNVDDGPVPFASVLRQEVGSLSQQFSFTGLPTPSLTNSQSTRNGFSFTAEPATPPQSQLEHISLSDKQADDRALIAETPCHTKAVFGTGYMTLPSRSASPLSTRKVQRDCDIITILSQQSKSAKGSEDLMIVPDSEADMIDDEEEEEQGDTGFAMKLNLKQFAFSEGPCLI